MQWKLRFFGSALGYLWQLVRPLLLFLVLYVFFTVVAKVGASGGPDYDYYGAQLLASIVLFTFFAEATMNAVRGVVDNEPLVRKIQFPRLVIPLSIVLLALFNLSLNLIVVTIFALIAGVRPMLTWLEVPVIILVLVMLCTGIAMLLSALFVYFRDVQPIWEVVQPGHLLRLADHHPDCGHPGAPVRHALMHLYMLNPLAVIFQEFRHAFINHATPSAASLLGGRDLSAGAPRDRGRRVRGRLLRVQPDRPARGRGPVARAISSRNRSSASIRAGQS